MSLFITANKYAATLKKKAKLSTETAELFSILIQPIFLSRNGSELHHLMVTMPDFGSLQCEIEPGSCIFNVSFTFLFFTLLNSANSTFISLLRFPYFLPLLMPRSRTPTALLYPVHLYYLQLGDVCIPFICTTYN